MTNDNDNQSTQRQQNKADEQQTKRGSSWWITKVLSTLGSIYLLVFLFEPLGLKIKQVGATEAIIFSAILLFNSSLLENADELSLSSTGISLKKVREKVNEIDKTQTEQIKKIEKLQQNQTENLKFLVRYLVGKDEVNHLKNLEAGKGINITEDLVDILRTELHHLRSLDFIKGEGISRLHQHVGQNIKDLGFEITKPGKDYLEQRKRLEIDKD